MTSTTVEARATLPVWRQPLDWIARSRVRRNIVIATAGITVAAAFGVAAAVGLLLWRLSEGPIRLDAIQSTIAEAVARELGNVQVEIKGAQLARDADGGTVVRLADVILRDADGQLLARAPQAIVGTRLISAALGSVVPTRIELIGPHVSVRRSIAGTISLGFRPPPTASGDLIADRSSPQADPPLITGDVSLPAGTQHAAAGNGGPAPLADGAGAAPGGGEADPAGEAFSPASVLSAGDGDVGFLGSVNQLVVSDARLTLFDEASQSVWDSYDATLRVTRPGGGLAVYVDAPFSTDSGEWRIRVTVERDSAESDVLVDAAFDNVVPSEIAARMPALSDLSVLDLPVSGRISATVDSQDAVEAVIADLRLGAGFIRRLPFSDVAIEPFLVDEGRLAVSYDREKARIDVQQFVIQIGPNRVGMTGTIQPERDADGRVVAAQFDLRSEDISLAAEDLVGDPATVERALASGRMLFDRSTLEIDTVAVEFAQGRITLGAMATSEAGEAVSIQGRIENLPVATLVQIWPRGVAPGARAWIAARIPRGTLREGKVNVDLDPDALAAASAGQAMPEDAMSIEFSFDDVAAHYLDPLPPITNAAGSALITGDKFVLSLDEARLMTPSGAPLAINFGRFEVPTFVYGETGSIPGRINVGTASTTAAALELLDLNPLQFTRELGIRPAGVAGDATILLDLNLPLENDVGFADISFQAGATLSRLAVPDAFRGINLEADTLNVIATQQEVRSEGMLRLNGMPAEASWVARFDEPGGRTNRLLLKGNVDAEGLASLGIDVTRFLSGSAPMSIEATGRGSSLDQTVVHADVTDAELHAPAIAWVKPSGEQASLDFTVERLDNDQVRLRDIVLKGNKVAMEGAIRLDPDGSLYKVDISRLKLGPVNDLQINGVRGEGGVLRLNVRGRELDAARLLRRTIADDSPSEANSGAKPVNVDFAFDVVRGEAGTALLASEGRIEVRAGRVSNIRIRGAFESRQPIRVDYGVGGGGTQAVVEIETSDAGAFARFVGLYSRAYGGTMSVRAQGPDSKRLSGTVHAREFQVRDEQLIVAIAKNTSAMAARAARDVTFSKLNLTFERKGGAIDIKDALIAAPAVGASLRGLVDLAGERLDLSGTYIPAYGLNAAFGGIPLFGPILSGRSGEGMFGMTFAVDGGMSDPKVTINPVSTIAPGLMRRLFEFNQRR